MIPLQASRLLIYREVTEDPTMAARAERLMTGISAEEVEYDVTDARVNDLLAETKLHAPPLMGMNNDNRPVVIFNHWRFDEPYELTRKRTARFPILFSNGTMKFEGRRGF
ncbi:MAG: hypothetical protein J7M26_06455, partial [Armatimonadetes bacterium]|nr:hypothetical protein [Armatimonadota bacterium]